MKHWPTKPLGAVCAINPKLSTSEIPEQATQVSFVPMAAVDEITGAIARPELRQYSQVAKGYTPFRENDVLFAKITPCMQNGKAAIARGLHAGLGFGSTEFHVLRPTSCVLPEWVFAFIRQPSFRTLAEANFTGSAGQQRVPTDFLRNIPIAVPPLLEQERIVALLDEADELRKLRAQADRHSAALIPALFHEMFGDPATSTTGWPIVRLVDVTSPKQWPTITQEQLTDSGFPVYGANGRIGFYSEFNHPEETVLVTCRGATCGTINICEPKSYVTGNAMSLDDPNPELLNVPFLASVLRVRGVQDTITGSAQPQITRQSLARVSFPLPPLGLQTEFAQRVKDIRALEVGQSSSRSRMDALFQSMLHGAFSGTI